MTFPIIEWSLAKIKMCTKRATFIMHMKKKKLIWTEYAKNRQNMSASRGDMLAFTGMKYQSCDIKDLKFLVFFILFWK